MGRVALLENPKSGGGDAEIVERELRAGRIEGQSGVHSRRGPAFEVEVEPDTSFNVDGELCVRSGRITFTVEREAVRLVVG